MIIDLGFGSWSLNLNLCSDLDLDLGLVLDLDTAAGMGLGMGTQTWTRNPGVLELTCHLQYSSSCRLPQCLIRPPDSGIPDSELNHLGEGFAAL